MVTYILVNKQKTLIILATISSKIYLAHLNATNFHLLSTEKYFRNVPLLTKEKQAKGELKHISIYKHR